MFYFSGNYYLMAKVKPQLIGMPWEFDLLWNEALRSIPERPLQKRSHIWASEIGRDYCNRYLKMHAHPYSNPYGDRSKRKFSMGHIIEWIVSVVLTVTGILKSKQVHGIVEMKDCLRVTGKLDFVAGGEVDWEFAKAEVKRIHNLFQISIDEMPPIIMHAVNLIINRMESVFTRVPLREYIFECKSIGGRMADRLDSMPSPMQNHEMQVAHYLIAEKAAKKVNHITEGLVVYISKDDAFCKQYVVELTNEVMKKYRDDVKQMTGYYNNSGSNYMKNLPPVPQELVFTPAFTFVKNFELEYSPYLTMLYPQYKDFEAFKWRWENILKGWNSTFKRCVLDKKMTPLNLQRIKEATKVFPEWDKYVIKARKAGAFKKEEEDEE